MRVPAENEGRIVCRLDELLVDRELTRPGRLDRSIAVLPPDEPARAAILHHHLRTRPCKGVNLAALARTTENFTGADLAHLCDSAVEIAMMDSVRTGRVRMVTMADSLQGRQTPQSSSLLKQGSSSNSR